MHIIKQGKVILIFSIFLIIANSLDPTRQIQLYPNTQNSDSIYIFSFKLSKDIPSGSYILVNLDWYTDALTPYKCIMVNTSIQLSCTNFGTPLFPLTITVAKLKQHNPLLNQAKTLAVLLNNNLSKSVQYNLQLHLYNKIPNIRKISPSSELYVVSKDSLVYQQNINYGPAIHRPPIETVLVYTVLNSLSLNRPGTLSTLKAQFRITIPIQTDLSAMTLVLHDPFSFSLGSLPRSYPSQSSATNSSVLLSKPTISEYRIISPNIFYVVFSEKFVAGRRFILQITEINNPYILAQSNISIYSMNYNSLTPLQGLQHAYPIQTVSYPLTINLNVPFDQNKTGSRQFYKSVYQFVKVDLTVLHKSVPIGYSIRIVLTGGTVVRGTAYCSINSLTDDPIYVYGSNYIIIKNIGQILVGTKIQTTFQIYKNPTPTTFSFDVYIDTDAIITAFTSSRYMYQGNVVGTTIDKNTFLSNIYDSVLSYPWRISHDVIASTYIIVTITPTGSQATSTGAFLQIYLPPYFKLGDSFNINTDCRFGNVVNSATCIATKSGSEVKLQIKSTNQLLNPLPFGTTTTIYLYNVIPPRSTSNKFIYPCYFTLFKGDAPGAVEYYDTHTITVMPKYGALSALRMQQHNNVYDSDYTYPGFLRVQSTITTEMSYVLQQNQIRIITVISRYGFQGMGSLNNQDPYPCTSNIDVKCTFLAGHKDLYSLQQMLQWDRIVIQFPSGQQSSKIFHVIIPDSVRDRQHNYYYHFVGTYNKLTKDYNYLYMKDAFLRHSFNWVTGVASYINTSLYVNFGGKAGSYKKNVTINIHNTNKNTGDFSFLCISTSWPFYEKGISSINALSLALTNPTLGTNQAEPLSVYMGSGMYLTAIPMKYTNAASALTDFTIMLDNVHLPYQYDLPNYYIYFIDSGKLFTQIQVFDNVNQGDTPNGNVMTAANQFIMTNAGIFYESPLKSLTINCNNNALGVKNTICTIKFGTQNPLKADGKIRLVFSGMTIATDVCKLYMPNNTLIQTTCSSTADNKNLTVSMSGFEHYSAGQYTLIIYGVGITESQISQSFVLYLYDSNAKYVIQKGNRILTTTIAKQKIIEVYEILYLYNSPLSFNKMSIKFYLPRQIYGDEEFGFIMGKDLSDVNTEIKRLNIKLIKYDGTQLKFLYRLISTEFKVMFTFDDPSLLTESNYTLEIYGIRTPASHQNGQFNIIFQRKFDKVYTLINQISASFPALRDYIISDMSIVSYFNTEGYDQQIDITIKNRALPVNNKMIWIVNLPSYYSPLIFNYQPYCLIEGSPIDCQADSNTPYQLIIKNSPRIVAAGTSYKISILGIACPRVVYMGNTFPNRYMFIGILQNSLSQYYQQTNLIYPQQNIYNLIPGIIGVQNIIVSSTNLTSFYNVYMTIVLKCNIAISANQYLYVIFPPQFNNFNNKALNIILRTNTTVLGTFNAPIFDRRMQIQIPSNIALNTQIHLQMTNVPTPTQQVSSQMSSIISFVTSANKFQITAASAVSGNSAPKLIFKKDTKYISFNNDQTVTITAGTYSSLINIKSSDSNAFLTNVKIGLASSGFTFQPSNVLLKLGDSSAKFRIGADKDLYPISYFYSTTKTQQVQIFYTITTNNNIMITNTPVPITVPTSINLPKGGCSVPFTFKLTNPPVIDMSITFNYNNSMYDQSTFFVNPHTTKSLLTFTKDNDNNTFSFCTSSNITGSNISVTLVLTGTNYFSYQFTPSNVIVFNLVNSVAVATPSVVVNMINQQKTFIDFNLTLNVDGLVYYHLFIGDSISNVLSAQNIQIYLKNQVSLVQKKTDFMTKIYLLDRDQRVGQVSYTAGQYTLRFNDMIPQSSYVFCAYLQNNLRVTRGPFCQVVMTQSWGNFLVMKLSFSKTVSDFQLNKVMCFFTKYVNSTTNYLINIEGNTCNDNAIKNTNYLYNFSTFSNDHKSTLVYLAPNPYLTSDPSVVAFSNMFDATNNFNAVTLAAALSGYGIDFITIGYNLKSMNIRQTSIRSNAQNLVVSFTKPVYSGNKITVDNIILNSGPNFGTVYFVLIKYKQFVTNVTTGLTSVRIRLNSPPSAQQMLNCKNWQNYPAQGCTRAAYSGTPLKIELTGVQDNSMYLLYYMAANQYPFRPVVGYTVRYQSIVTMNYANNTILICKSFLVLLFLMIWNR